MQRMKLFTWAFALMLVVPAIALASDEISPMAVDGATTIDAAKAKQLFDQGVLFVDVRSNKDWDAGRIPGSEHMELKSVFNEQSLMGLIGKGDAVVLYCNGEKCLRSSKATSDAVGWGFSKVYYFRDGFPAWQAAGFPVE